MTQSGTQNTHFKKFEFEKPLKNLSSLILIFLLFARAPIIIMSMEWLLKSGTIISLNEAC